MKRSRIVAAMTLSITMLAASVAPVCAQEQEPVSLSISASPEGTDITVDEWELSLHIPAGIKYKLDSEYDNLYFYAMDEGSIPYVMVRSYEYTDASDVAGFLDNFIEEMKEYYTDLEVVEGIQEFDAEKYMFLGTQVEYTISGDHKVLDTRLAIQNNDKIVLVSIKEIPDEGYVVGDLPIQIIRDMDLKGVDEADTSDAKAGSFLTR
ncbi:MAG: hypothetical protein HUJ76_10945 [Parasporobacterium sp.]|nr:hypothetical protein [Parasporobacterium sp.]